ncbi:MAG TPA: endolytic transglycosylase MltG [Anaerolineales bacterium]|nr:endolytic transglycosylase MltG [Anaerolineales bacterium]
MKRLFVIVLLLLLCGAAFFSVWGVNGIPARAEAAFGAASPNLNPAQRLLLSWRLLRAKESLTSAVNLFAQPVAFRIELGESPVSVAQRLEDGGIISDAAAFRDFLVYAGLDTRLQAGDYHLSPAQPPLMLAYALLDAAPGQVNFAILAGWRLEQIAETLPTSGLEIDPADFLSAARARNLEGYLLPGVYPIPREITAPALLDMLTGAFEAAISEEMRAGFAAQGLSLDEAVALASIVQREISVSDEAPLVASVFVNRLAAGMRLESDTTVQYALGYNAAQDTWWTNPLSVADLETDSAYNTYLYPGLPPGPICNPGLDSLRAVAFPAQTTYYYFRAACDGSGRHNFAETYAEHVQNACP